MKHSERMTHFMVDLSMVSVALIDPHRNLSREMLGGLDLIDPWIDLNIKLPPHNEPVLCVNSWGIRSIYQGSEVHKLWNEALRENEDCVLTHWQHLPPPPRGSGEAMKAMYEQGAKPAQNGKP